MLLDELKALAAKSSIEGCVVGVWAKEQDEEFQEVFATLRNKPNLPLQETLRLIEAHYSNIPFKRTSFAYHMRGTCTCPKA
ncbi:hypothetical protein UFOVP115_73 [uncultured Caudovirales phage]|uniref:Uncharacterized protein n=1 Tax=uncultured Caudovirales phage TaxID=2100421 RepID=A0A6J5L6H0_9CAUD|nr:hypothetical protein UFOVP115_73 [uncultured Caudovirales phage]